MGDLSFYILITNLQLRAYYLLPMDISCINAYLHSHYKSSLLQATGNNIYAFQYLFFGYNQRWCKTDFIAMSRFCQKSSIS